jgi:mannose-6-phosphate isomerase-like protein (cupin superfamily)
MKVVRNGEGQHFAPPDHWGVYPIKQHGKDETGTGGVWTALSVYLPEGGGEDKGMPVERIYYVLSGTMTIRAGDREINLQEGDSVYRPPMEAGRFWNSGRTPCVSLVIGIPSES